MPPTRAPIARWPRLAAVAAAMLAFGCTGGAHVSGSDAARIEAAERTVDSLHTLARSDEAARTVDDRPAPHRLDDAGALVLLYLERARLGLGSPFQLAELALADPRLAPDLGRTVAWALVGRAARGTTHEVDPAALTDVADPWRPGALVDGERHRTLVDSVVVDAPTARTGELTVRLAYELARVERLVTDATADAATPAAALARDRRLAREDATRLLAAADRRTTPGDSNALAVLGRWRRERRLAVERPLLADDLRPDDARAARDAERLLAELRLDATRSDVSTAPDSSQSTATTAADTLLPPLVPSTTAPAPDCATPSSLLPCRTAARLAALERARNPRPDAFVTITLGGYRSDVARADHDDDSIPPTDDSGLARRMAARARTADALTAEWARARATLPPDGVAHRRLARLVHAVAVAARPFSQAPLPSAAALDRGVVATADRLRLGAGLSRLVFDRGLDAGWRVPALLDLESAISDLRLALPGLSLDGLSVRIGSSPKGDLALALHDPGSRTIYLPPVSGAGTIAHELAHDLDWQTARTQLGLRGTYATDRAARLGAEPLATAVRGLADTRTRTTGRGRPPSDRPAELFARGVDWYVAAVLAREGRMNGALSSVQDLDLPGFASATVPIPGTGSGDAILEALRRVTPLSPVAEQWFRGRFGPAAPLPAGAVARLALDATFQWGTERTYLGLGIPAGLADEPPRGDGPTASSCPLQPWQRRLLWVAADARARGMVRGQAGRAELGGWPLWRSRAVLGPPWRDDVAEESHRRFRDAVLRGALRGLAQRAPFGEPSHCL